MGGRATAVAQYSRTWHVIVEAGPGKFVPTWRAKWVIPVQRFRHALRETKETATRTAAGEAKHQATASNSIDKAEESEMATKAA